MGTTRTISLWLAPIAVALLSITLLFAPRLGSSSKAPSLGPLDVCGPGDDAISCKDLVEVEVKDVVPLEEVNAHAIVLVSKRDQTLLPIFVDQNDGDT